jgi:hypothetical protein
VIRSSTLLYDGPCYGDVSHAPLPDDGPRTLALADAPLLLASRYSQESYILFQSPARSKAKAAR